MTYRQLEQYMNNGGVIAEFADKPYHYYTKPEYKSVRFDTWLKYTKNNKTTSYHKNSFWVTYYRKEN